MLMNESTLNFFFFLFTFQFVRYCFFAGHLKQACFPLFSSVYAEEDQLLWQPDMLPESKVKSFLQDALRVDGKMDGDGKCSLVRDNEQVKITDK